MSPRPERLPLSEALALGALHGPAELLPVSSSGHVTLVPWLLGWRAAHVAPELRKAFEVALHAGTAAALLVGLRAEVLAEARALDRSRLAVLALACAPAGAAGLALEGPIERRLGTPRGIAAGLLAGGAALAVADALAPGERGRAEASARDGLALGLAQALALAPGVSRSGATIAAARARGFARPDAAALSRAVALPVIAGATGLKALRLARGGLPPGAAGPLAAGAGAAFAATLACVSRLAGAVERRPAAAFAAYRLALAALVLRRSRASADRPRRFPTTRAGIDLAARPRRSPATRAGADRPVRDHGRR